MVKDTTMVEPLGRRDEIIEPSTLTRWHLTQLLEQPKERGEDEERSPFMWRNDLNAKIALWSGNITKLNVHAITHSTNEHLNDDSPLTRELFKNGGKGLVTEIREDVRVCKTGEAKLTKGHNLPSRFVVHSVGPRYNVKYITAAESALFSCYRSTLQLCKESGIRTVGLGALHTLRRNFPPENGAHIGIRTVRRFLENHAEDIDIIIFVCTDETLEVYKKTLPLYFPRNSQEEDEAIDLLPTDIGNEHGEPVIHDRQIRIMDKPIFAAYTAEDTEFEQTIDLNKEFAQSQVLDVGHHPFAEMEENPDIRKAKHMLLQKNTKEMKEADNKKRYERLLRKAKAEDLTDIAALHCLYRTGIDRMGRPVVVFIGRNFPALSADPEKTLLYLIRVMDPVVDNDYVVVYFHTNTTGNNQPAMSYLKMVYSLLDSRYRKNLKHFYVIHPTWWSKLAAWFFTTFTASDIKGKVHNLKGVQFLFTRINPDQIDVPQFVQDHDIRVNGARYVVPEPETQEGL